MHSADRKILIKSIDDFISNAQKSFATRIETWEIDVFDRESNEVLGGLLARQMSLAINIARVPPVWNVHILPIVLRCMADVYITLSWIAIDSKPRSRQFIEYGLGQEKLAIEKYRECLNEEQNPDADALAFAEWRGRILDQEKNRFLVPVNLGGWSGIDTRKMAIEAGEKNFYDLVFTQFSASVHSTWQHIWQFNQRECTNPLHMGHRTPYVPEFAPDLQLFANVPKYLCKTFEKFDSAVTQKACADEPYHSFSEFVATYAQSSTDNSASKDD